MKYIATILLAAALAWAPAVAHGQVEVNDKTVTDSIKRAVDYLYGTANDEGHWDATGGPPDLAVPRGQKYPPGKANNWTGETALVLYALASAGQQNDPRFRKGLEWLVKQKPVGLYPVSLRLQLVSKLTNVKDHRRVMNRDARWLLSGARGMRNGGVKWDYMPPPHGDPNRPSDSSTANYVVLALWAAGDARYEVPANLWRRLEKVYTLGQNDDGGWAYHPKGSPKPDHPYKRQSTGSMTAAGIASLYLVLDRTYVRTGRPGAFRKSKAYASIGKGLEWMARNFSNTTNPFFPIKQHYETYYFYNCERVGAASGRKYFGTRDWFDEIAGTLLNTQGKNGSVVITLKRYNGGPIIDTAFALLFLARGSAPVICNKLEHPDDWNNHLRDMVGLTGWLERQSERPTNWQAVNLKVPAEDLTDSRILYIAGARKLVLTAEEKTKLKRYVDLGGTLVFHPDRRNSGFQQDYEKLLAELWPELELTQVDLKTHPLGKIYVPLEARLKVQQLATPTRVLAFVLHDQPARSWERRLYRSGESHFNLGAALHYFVNDRADLKKMPTKLTYFAEDFRGTLPNCTRNVTLARISHGKVISQWDPEPVGMERFARRLALREQVDCRVQSVHAEKLAELKPKVAHLTGTAALDLGQREWDAIDAWLKAGGTLIVDQAGGPRAGRKEPFDESFRKLIEDRYGDDALHPIKVHPALGGLGKVAHRNVQGVRRRMLAPRLESVRIGGRQAIIYSRYDLSCGLLGNPNPLVSGLDGEAAYDILSRLVLSAAGIERSKPKSQ